MASCAADGAGDHLALAQLDEATHSDERPVPSPRGPWAVSLYDLAGEASLAWSTPRPPLPEKEATDSDDDRGDGERPACQDPERAAVESARRARITMRRHCTALGINQLGTATFRCRRCDRPEGCTCDQGADRPKHDELDYVLDEVARFRRLMMAEVGKVPLVVVVEAHKDGHLHVHFGYPKWLDVKVVERCWRRGFVKLRGRKRAPGQAKVGQRERARACAGYLSKYISKDSSGHGRGRKSYSTTRGLVPPPRRTRFMTKGDAERWLAAATGMLPERIWSSEDMPGWEAPPVMLLFYGDPP